MEELATIQSKIYEIRGQRVMLDFDLAALYQVETRVLKQAVRRNIERFEGEDFMFTLSDIEYNSWSANRIFMCTVTGTTAAVRNSILRPTTFHALSSLPSAANAAGACSDVSTRQNG